MSDSGYNNFEHSGEKFKNSQWEVYLGELRKRHGLCSAHFLRIVGEMSKENEKNSNQYFKEKIESQINDLLFYYESVEKIMDAYRQHSLDTINRADKLKKKLDQVGKVSLERLRSFYIHICHRNDRLEEQAIILDILCEIDKLLGHADN